MKQPSILIKAIIKEKISNFEYIVENTSNGNLVNMYVSGKHVIHYLFEIGKEVCVECNPYDLSKGRFDYKKQWYLSSKFSDFPIEL